MPFRFTEPNGCPSAGDGLLNSIGVGDADSQREHVLAEIVEFPVGKAGDAAMLVFGPAGSEHLTKGGRRSVVQVRGRAPSIKPCHPVMRRLQGASWNLRVLPGRWLIRTLWELDIMPNEAAPLSWLGR